MKKTGNKKEKAIYLNKRKKPNNKKTLLSVLILLTASIIIISTIFIYDKFANTKEPISSLDSSEIISSSNLLSEDFSSEPDIISSEEPISSGINISMPEPGQPMFFGKKNPVLSGASFNNSLIMGKIANDVLPASLNFTSVIYKGTKVLEKYQRPEKINMLNPYDYADVAGVLTFRGNNFRNSGSFGYVSMKEKKLEQIWERSMGGMPSSRWDFSWSGTGWTGQPVMVQWEEDIRQMMNIYPEKKNKKGLVEVITAAMDGHIYFYDLEDGKDTRPAIKIGVAVKGTPAIDPRGYPLLYVGQGDYPPKNSTKEMGFRIFNLLDNSLLYFHNTGKENRSYRNSWGAQDSSPIIDKNSDTLIYPCENGMVYTGKLNTEFDKAAKTISITPEFVDYKYKSKATDSQGIESSVAIYGSYAYFADNSGTLNCIDLNTLKPLWTRKLYDDTDVTPTLQQEGDRLFLYCGAEVDNQKPITGIYKGEAYVYKIDALTGEIMWHASYPAWTKNDVARPGNDINGGIMGSLIVGKGKYSNLVLASICMTEGFSVGNTIAAFDATTGKLQWEYKMNHYSWGSPIDVYDANGKMYIVMTDYVSQIHLIDGDNGSRLDYIQLARNFKGPEPVSGGNIESSAAIFGDYLVVGTRGGLLAGVKLR